MFNTTCHVCNEEIMVRVASQEPYMIEVHNTEECDGCGRIIHDGCCVEKEDCFVCFECEGMRIEE